MILRFVESVCPSVMFGLSIFDSFDPESWFLAHSAFVRRNRRAVAIIFVRLSICASVCLGL